MRRLRIPPSASLDRLLAGTARAVRRFPEVFACGVVAGVAASLALESGEAPRWWGLWRAASLGIPLFVALTVLCERRSIAEPRRWLWRTAALGGLVLLYVLFDGWEYWSIAQRYGHLSVTLHLSVAVVPYLFLAAEEPRGFWQFNFALLHRFVVATIYAAAIYAGLALALAALDNLFGVDVEELAYVRLFFLVAFCFHPAFFLAGVPTDFSRLDRDGSGPPWLKVFCQYVMLPLVTVYVIILTAYLGRILVIGTWPSGWISYLVSSLAVIGILSLLMVHPERLEGPRGWIDRYALAFWIAIMPSVVMVLMAVWQRTEQYGITERRYLLGILALWLGGAALYSAVTRTRGIRFIPLTLAVLGAVTFVGPWSAYAVAQRSQLARLEGVLSEHGALLAGRASGEVVEIPFEAWAEARSAVDYLVREHGVASLAPLLEGREAGGPGGGDDTLADTAPPGIAAGDSLARAQRWTRDAARTMGDLRIRPGVSYRPARLEGVQQGDPISVAGFELLLLGDDEGEVVIGTDTLRFALSSDGMEMVLEFEGAAVGRASLAALIDAGQQLRSRHFDNTVTATRAAPDVIDVPAREMTLPFDTGRWRVQAVLGSLEVERVDERMAATSFRLHSVLLQRNEDDP